ncbi:MAG TPA: Vms1/Ankzf1 family peptidyl-tRNA hydrolase [Micromonosporaceae bacterium]|nr:Vms1/Ankzf1 family peptidyl-tRNA hydrolase [Micromonosporaceae bacterium]
MNLGFLTDVYRAEGPYVTAYLQRYQVGEDAAQQVRLRWQVLAQRLRRNGADDATIAAMEQAVLPVRPGTVESQGRALVGADGEVLLDRPLRPRPRAAVPVFSGDQATWAPLPRLLPLLAHEQQSPPHLVVIADRVGADIHVFTEGNDRVTEVDGDDHPLRKVQAGGWSHSRFQQRAENQWEHNANLVATTVSKLATRHRAKLVLLAGDVRARAAISDHLPTGVRRIVVETEHGSRAPGAAEAPLRAEAARLASDVGNREHSEVTERFLADRGDPDRTAEGLEQVIEAVRAHAVATLLLDPAGYLDLSLPRRDLWVGLEEGTQLALSKTELEKLGVEEYAADRADAALIRACVTTAADLELLSSGDPVVSDGVAAVLRYPLPR